MAASTFTPILLADKQTLNVDGSAGQNTFLVNNPNAGVGLTTLNVQGGNSGDTFNVAASAGPVTTNLTGGAGNDVFNVSSDATNTSSGVQPAKGALGGIAGTLTINAAGGIANRLIVSDYGNTTAATTPVILTGTIGQPGAEQWFSINGTQYQRILGFAGPGKNVEIDYTVASGGNFTDPTTPANDGILLVGSHTVAENFVVNNTLGGNSSNPIGGLSTTEIQCNSGKDSVTANVDETKDYNLFVSGGPGDKLSVNDVTRVDKNDQPIPVGQSTSADTLFNGGAVIHNIPAIPPVAFHSVSVSEIDVAYLDKSPGNTVPSGTSPPIRLTEPRPTPVFTRTFSIRASARST